MAKGSNLSEYIMSANDYISYKWIDVKDVKDFIKKILEGKEVCVLKSKIEESAGDKLT